MTTFAVSDSWADQGIVSGTVTFTPLPEGTGEPVVARIVNSVLSTDLPIGSEDSGVQEYAAQFDDMNYNGFVADAQSFAFNAPVASETVSLRALNPDLKVLVSSPIRPPVPVGVQAVTAQGVYSTAVTDQLDIPECTQSFVVPPSGSVVVTYSVWVEVVTAASLVMSCQWSDTAGASGLPYDFLGDNDGNTSAPLRATATQVITGMTPGSTATLQPQITSDQNDTTIHIDPTNGYNAYSVVQPVY